jgi:hypothetical protein
MSLVISQQALLDTTNDLISAYLSTSYMRLFVSNIAVGPSTTLAELLAAEATFTGYAPVALTTWSTPTINSGGAAQTECTQGAFTGTASGGTGDIYGYFLCNSAGTLWYGGETFSSGPLNYAQNVQLDVDSIYTALSGS